MTKQKQEDLQNDEISLRDILAEMQLWLRLAKQNLLWLLLMGTLGGAAGFTYAWFAKPQYEAKLSFILKRNDLSGAAASLSGLSSLLGGGSNSAGNSLERIIQLAGSERIVGEALLSTAEVNGKTDLLANHFIRLNEMAEVWKEDSILNKGVQFKAENNFENLDYAQRKALKQITRIIAGNPENSGRALLSCEFDKNSAIIKLALSYPNEDFAITFTRALYASLVNFYTREAVASTSSNVTVLKQKVDSIKNALYATQKSAAKTSDQALGLILQEDRVDQKSLAVKENMLTLMYGEAQKNLETLSFMQYSTKPVFTIIDEPFAPIKPDQKSSLIFTILGIFFAVSILLVVFRISNYIQN